MQTVEKINKRLDELAQTKSLYAGLGGAFNQIPTRQQEQIMSAANGGIVAFNGDDESLVDDDNQSAALNLDQLTTNPSGDAEQRRKWDEKLLQAYENISNYQPASAMTDAERRAATLANYNEMLEIGRAHV